MAGKAAALEVVHPDCAGIDVGKRKHYVAVDGSRFERPVRHFGTFTEDLEAIARWLSECGVRDVAMESTGVYWIPLFEVLDRAGFAVHLVNPRATKQVSGRKSDVLDCQWIRQLMSYGLLRGAFRAADAICPMRAYARQREQLVRDRSRAVQHMQKALTQMNVQLDNVLSDIMGKTGQLIVRAIVAGERDGAALARFRDRRRKADAATIAAGFGAHVTVLDVNLTRLRYLAEVMPANVDTLYSNRHSILEQIERADVVIGAVLVPGGKAPKLVRHDDLRRMKDGSVIVDVAVDQGGCVESARPTTHNDPTYTVHGVVHYCVANMPGAVPRTSTLALTNATFPYVLHLANRGWEAACDEDPDLAPGVNIAGGRVTYEAVAQAFDLEYTPLEALSA